MCDFLCIILFFVNYFFIIRLVYTDNPAIIEVGNLCKHISRYFDKLFNFRHKPAGGSYEKIKFIFFHFYNDIFDVNWD